MVLNSGEPHLFLLTFLSLLLLIHARLNLDRSDLKALSIIQKDLGINGQHHPSTSPCNTPGVSCERRLSNKHTYVLRNTRLVFSSQHLTGFLSPEIGRLSELKELSVSNNYLVDQLPPQIVECRKLEVLDLRSNRLSGKIPLELSSLIRLRVLDLSSHKFSGNLGFLKYFPNLENFSLADNLFTGKIPTSVRSFRNLRFFNFTGNLFQEGSMPMMNRFEYSVSNLPKRYTFAENSTRRNNTSSVAPSASKASSAQAPSPSASPQKYKNTKRKLITWILGFFAGAVAGGLSGFIFPLLFERDLAPNPISGEVKNARPRIRGKVKDPRPLNFTSWTIDEDFAFLEENDGLASLEFIGRGGCGEVYKAELPGSRWKMIAIKKIVQPPEEDGELLDRKIRQIRSEIQTVGHIRHRNLVPLLAIVSRPDCHYLVYEFMKNGSLQDVLNQVSQGTRELHWLARYKIALGVAAGLEYLHTSLSPCIIHRDLKPANILLDDSMEARISDFGLAKAMSDANMHITTSTLVGTVGYIAPEYHQTLKFTDKCDIFSVGVVLGILVTGKLPSDEFFEHTIEMTLIKWMRNIMTSETPQQAIDPKLMGNGFEKQMILVLKIACLCTLDNPKERPNSRELTCMLSKICH